MCKLTSSGLADKQKKKKLSDQARKLTSSDQTRKKGRNYKTPASHLLKNDNDTTYHNMC